MSGPRIAAIQLLCPDPWATARFFEAAFDARPIAPDPAIAIGEQIILLAPSSRRLAEIPPLNATSFQHCAIVVVDMAAAYARLGNVAGWTPISRRGPELLPVSSGGVIAFKFRDPDGHPLELLQFPAKGVPPPWQGKSGLCLGIDHTAITVADTGRSVVFYQALGFKVRSRGENCGIEQARMDGVDDPHVEVTGLQPSGGAPPHLELLCYRRPETLEVSAAEGDVLATCVVLSGRDTLIATPPVDPDGHRLDYTA